MGGGFTSGTVTAVDEEGFTVETEDGESVTVAVSDDTSYSVTEEIAIDDLAEGDEVQAQGETDDDGVVSAEVVRVGDVGAAFAGGGGFPGGGGPGAPGAGADDDAETEDA
jgi:hypothetical protein